MAQVNDLLVLGKANFIDILKFNQINVPTEAGGTAYGPGSNGQVLKSNGTTVYWGTDSNPTLSGLGGVGTITASGTAPLTLSATKSGTTVTINGSVDMSWNNVTGKPTTDISWSNRTLTVKAAGSTDTADIPTTLSGFSKITSSNFTSTTNFYINDGTAQYARLYKSAAGEACTTADTYGTVGVTYLILGNSTAKSKVVGEGAGNNYGILRLYNEFNRYAQIKAYTASDGSDTSNTTHTLPATTGTILNTGTTSVTPSLTSGTKVATIKLNGTNYNLYCETNTDAKVTQSEATVDTLRPIILGKTNSSSASGLTTSVTDGVHVTSKFYANPGKGILYAPTFSGNLTGNVTGNVSGTAGQLTSLTSTDMASATDTQRRIWFCYNDNVTGRPAYDDDFTYQVSTGTVTATIFKGALQGNASTASAFSSAATVKLTGDVTGSVSSTKGWTVATTRRGCSVGQNSSTSTNPWYKFASIKVSTAHQDEEIAFKVTCGFSNISRSGILRAHVRLNENRIIASTANAHLYWEYVDNGIDVNNFVLAYSTAADPTVELWVNIPAAWTFYHFDVLQENSRTNRGVKWTLYNTSSAGSQSAITSGYTQITSTALGLLNNAATATSATSATKATQDGNGSVISSTYLKLSGGTMTGPITMNAGTGLAMKYTSGGNDVWMYPNGAPTYGIRYFEGSPDKMAFSATANNDTVAGADLCINGNGDGTVTMRGNNILHAGNTSFTRTLTSGTKIGTIKINGTSTDIYCETNTNTDTKVTQSASTTSSYRHLLLHYSTGTSPDSTTGQVYYAAAIYAKPSNGTLYATTFSGNLTGNVTGNVSGTSGGLNSNVSSIELNSGGTLASYGGFIDFHYHDADKKPTNASGTVVSTTPDYTSRIIENAAGQIAINSVTIKGSTITGTLSGNASSATKFYATKSVAASTQYFIPFVSGSSSGNKDAYFHPRVYLWDTGSRMHLCVGEQGTSTSDATGAYSGGLTINSGSGKGKYVDIIPAAMTGHRTLTIPDASGTICLTSHNHDSTYLKLSGGTMTGNITLKNTGNTVNAHIVRSGISQSWYQGRNSAMIKTTSYSGYDAILSMKTTAGDWALGVYSDNKLYFTYILDSNYNANTNTTTAQIRFDPDGTVVASKFSGSLAGNATSADKANRSRFLETKKQDGSDWYGSDYPVYAQWESSTVCKLKVDSYSTKVDEANKLSTARTLTIGHTGKTFNGTANVSWTPFEMRLTRAQYNVGSNMNQVADHGCELGMANLSGTDTTVNPGGATSWHHYINMTWSDCADNNSSTTNEWCTQIANKAGTTDLWVRSRGGGTIADGTAWAAPWTRILTGSNWTNVIPVATNSTLGITKVWKASDCTAYTDDSYALTTAAAKKLHSLFYTTCSTAAGTAAKTAACTPFALVTGAIITVKFTVTNTAANPTLNVNSTGAKAIYYRGAAIAAGYLAAGRTYTFVYNGTQYELIGDINVNSDTKVTQTVRTTAGEFPILVRGTTAGTTTTTTTASFAANATINPSTGAISAPTLNAQRTNTGCLVLTNTEWTGYGASPPDQMGLSAVTGRVYFQLI